MSYAFPPVVLVHGWGGSFEGTWARTGWVEALTKAGRAVIPVNLIGHGTKDASADPNDYGDIAGALDAILPHGPLDALGFSLGGKIVLELACRQPARFRRLVIAGLGDNIFAKEIGRPLAEALLRGFPPEDRARMPHIATYVDESTSDYKALAAALMRPPNPVAETARLQAIESEILIINGDADPVAEPNGRLREALPQADYLSLPGVDHFAMHHQISFRQGALAFLNGRSDG
jgi:pimeloyl-ACP methyl ester carboxylesterase